MSVNNMRVSNVHHETSVHSLFYMQEVEPETYARLTQRIGGIDMAGKMGVADYFIHELPFMFKDWAEYRDYLLDKLIEDLEDNDEVQEIYTNAE
jgi:predicted phosphoadenosine phosphosulfate sulfurtransferase